MRDLIMVQPSPGRVVSPPAKLPQLPPEVQQQVICLLARMLNEHRNRQLCLQRSASGDSR